jgi:cell wall-associated NlpC family hydrolase
VAFALAQRGKPYQWGATGPGSYDCSGLTQTAYAYAGVIILRVAAAQWYAGTHVSMGELQAGDLVFFATNLADPGTIHHVGMYIGARADGGGAIHGRGRAHQLGRPRRLHRATRPTG